MIICNPDLLYPYRRVLASQAMYSNINCPLRLNNTINHPIIPPILFSFNQYTTKVIPSYHGTTSEKTKENNYMSFTLRLASFNQPTIVSRWTRH
jgi:hypothetical protein